MRCMQDCRCCGASPCAGAHPTRGALYASLGYGLHPSTPRIMPRWKGSTRLRLLPRQALRPIPGAPSTLHTRDERQKGDPYGPPFAGNPLTCQAVRLRSPASRWLQLRAVRRVHHCAGHCGGRCHHRASCSWNPCHRTCRPYHPCRPCHPYRRAWAWCHNWS